MEKSINDQIADAEKTLNSLKEKAKKEANKNNPLKISELQEIYNKLGCDPKNDIIKISGLDAQDHAVIAGIADRIRICKVYNKGILPTKSDKRWFPWSLLNKAGSGLVFNSSCYYDDLATLDSASRLSFLTEEASTAYFKNFQKIEETIIGL